MVVFALFGQYVEIHFRIFEQQFLFEGNFYLFLVLLIELLLIKQIKVVDWLELVGQSHLMFRDPHTTHKSWVLVKGLSLTVFLSLREGCLQRILHWLHSFLIELNWGRTFSELILFQRVRLLLKILRQKFLWFFIHFKFSLGRNVLICFFRSSFPNFWVAFFLLLSQKLGF